MGDRAYAFVRTPGPKGFPWHTGREQEDLILYRPRYREPAGTILPVDVERTFGMAPGVNPIFPHGAPSRSSRDAGRADAAGRLGRAQGRARGARRVRP